MQNDSGKAELVFIKVDILKILPGKRVIQLLVTTYNHDINYYRKQSH